jgi:hypothetical protein
MTTRGSLKRKQGVDIKHVVAAEEKKRKDEPLRMATRQYELVSLENMPMCAAVFELETCKWWW